MDGLASGPYLPSVSSLRETHFARIDTILKFKHDNINGLIAAFRWREFVPDILLSSMAVHCDSYSDWQSDSCKPIDDAVDPDAGSWLHLPCHSHSLHNLLLVFKVS